MSQGTAVEGSASPLPLWLTRALPSKGQDFVEFQEVAVVAFLQLSRCLRTAFLLHFDFVPSVVEREGR